MNVKIFPSKAKGSVTAPPSKSYAHRLLIGSAMAKGESILHHVAPSQDILATMDCLTALGASFTMEGDTVYVTGCGGAPEATAPLCCRESGSTLRFLLPLTLLSDEGGEICGTPRLMERGISVYQSVLSHKNITFSLEKEAIFVKGQLTPSEFSLKGDVSSQFISGLFFALPLLNGDSTVRVLPPVESRSYIDMTVDALARFGIQIVEAEENTFFIKGNQAYEPLTATVEGDWSNAAFLFGLNHLGGAVSVLGLEENSYQGDKICLDYFSRLSEKGKTIDLQDCPDLAPVLFALASTKGHDVVFSGTKRLKMKESDRAATMAEELSKMGIRLSVLENQVIVHGGTLTPPTARLCGHGDHRIVMALSLLLTLVGGEIEGADAVSKSYPDFFTQLKHLGIEVKDATNER